MRWFLFLEWPDLYSYSLEFKLCMNWMQKQQISLITVFGCQTFSWQKNKTQSHKPDLMNLFHRSDYNTSWINTNIHLMEKHIEMLSLSGCCKYSERDFYQTYLHTPTQHLSVCGAAIIKSTCQSFVSGKGDRLGVKHGKENNEEREECQINR